MKTDEDLVKVELLADTSVNKKGELRDLNPDRARAWVEGGIARYLDDGPGRKR